MAGQRSGFAGHTFHEVAVSANGVDVEIKNLETGLVEIRREPPAGDRHSHAIACALSQWAGCGFDAGSQVGLGMAGSFAADLAEALDFVHGDGGRLQDFAVLCGFLHAGEVKRGVEKHGSMAIGENEAVANWPTSVGR